VFNLSNYRIVRFMIENDRKLYVIIIMIENYKRFSYRNIDIYLSLKLHYTFNKKFFDPEVNLISVKSM